jgi:hypothetical protein
MGKHARVTCARAEASISPIAGKRPQRVFDVYSSLSFLAVASINGFT